MSSPVNLSGGLPSTVLPPDPLDTALAEMGEPTHDAVAPLVAQHPRSLIGWATLGELATDPMVRYAFPRRLPPRTRFAPRRRLARLGLRALGSADQPRVPALS